MINKKQARLRRSKRARAKIEQLGIPRLSVHRSSKHIYAQIINPTNRNVLASVATTQKEIQKDLTVTGNIDAAKLVGKAIASKAKEQGIIKVAFDRSGFKYHGRVQALAEAARAGGLDF